MAIGMTAASLTSAYTPGPAPLHLPETQLATVFAYDDRDELIEHSRWSLRAFDDKFAARMRTPPQSG